jgi:hypothetical protein
MYNTVPKNKLNTRFTNAKRKYGISEEDYSDLWQNQNGLCAICGVPLQNILMDHTDLRYKSAIDHDHETGRVRGLLCGACNCAIGYMQDDPERLVPAAGYLLSFQDVLSSAM